MAHLRIEGTGPQTAIYRTMLLAEKFHVKGADGLRKLAPPGKRSSYFPAWQAVDSRIKAGKDAPLMITELIHQLKQPPFGLKDGPIPILITR